jgi:hypothetical protein
MQAARHSPRLVGNQIAIVESLRSRGRWRREEPAFSSDSPRRGRRGRGAYLPDRLGSFLPASAQIGLRRRTPLTPGTVLHLKSTAKARYKRRVSRSRDSAACAHGNGRIILLHVPLAPPGIAKAEVGSKKSGARMKNIHSQRSGFCFMLLTTALRTRAVSANRILAVDRILLPADKRTRI